MYAMHTNIYMHTHIQTYACVCVCVCFRHSKAVRP